MKNQSLMVRERGVMLDNFCMSFFSSMKFDEFKQVLHDLLCHDVYASIQGETWAACVKLIRLCGELVGFMHLFPFAIIFVTVSLFFGHRLYYQGSN